MAYVVLQLSLFYEIITLNNPVNSILVCSISLSQVTSSAESALVCLGVVVVVVVVVVVGFFKFSFLSHILF